jgi:ADP-ribose pyrophosphatase YjhB (NUDIX family)
MKREYPDQPIIGVGGIIFNSDTILLIKRDKPPGKGEWSLPGGAVELGETLLEALGREIEEETALKVKIGGLVRVLERIVYDKNGKIQFHYVIADYWGWSVSGIPSAGSDVSDAKFINLSHIEDMNLNNKVLETIKMAVEMMDRN